MGKNRGAKRKHNAAAAAAATSTSVATSAAVVQNKDIANNDSGYDTDEMIAEARASGLIASKMKAAQKRNQDRRNKKRRKGTGAKVSGAEADNDDAKSSSTTTAASTARQPVADNEEYDEAYEYQPESDDDDSDDGDIVVSNNEDMSADPSRAGIKLDGKSGEVVQLDFGLFDPCEIDWWTVKILLKHYIVLPSKANDYPGFDPTDMAHAIADQVTVGAMIKNESAEEQPLGCITALNLGYYGKRPFVSDIRTFLTKHCSDQHTCKAFENVFTKQAKRTALLVQERLINVPNQLVPPFYDSLLQDIEWACKNEEDSKLRASYNVDNYVIIARSFCDEKGVASTTFETTDAAASSAATATPANDERGDYFYFENTFLEKAASHSFTFAKQLHNPTSEVEKLPQRYTAMIIPKAALLTAIEMIKAVEFMA
jgi:protein BCP1